MGSNGASEGIDLDRFRTYERLEINRVLKDLLRHGEMATLYFNGGRDFVLTSLIDSNPETGLIRLDYGADEAANQRLFKAERVQFVTSHKGVRVQFAISGLRSAHWEGAQVLVADFPESIVRIQRREFYRLDAPLASPLRCRFVLHGESVESTVVDISLGGVGLLEPEAGYEPNLEPGRVIEECTIDLPGEGLIETPVEIHNAFEHTSHSGHLQRRVGCRFLELTPAMNARIQRYIHKVELERRRIARADILGDS